MASSRIQRKPPRDFASFAEYYQFYLSEHSVPANRRLHLLATAIFVLSPIPAVLWGRGMLVPLGFLVGLAIAIAGHVLFEGGIPKSGRAFAHSVLADFLMCYEMLTGKVAL